MNHQSLRKQSVLKKGFAKIGNAIPKIVAEESLLETMWVRELCPETLTGEKNVYAAVNPARYHISTFNFEKRVSAAPDQKVVGTDSVGLKNIYVPLIREGQHIGSGYIGSRPDMGEGVGELYRGDIEREHQGRGYAKELFAALFREAKNQGFTRLVSDSVMSNQAHRALRGMVRRGLAKEIKDPFGETRFEFMGYSSRSQRLNLLRRLRASRPSCEG